MKLPLLPLSSNRGSSLLGALVLLQLLFSTFEVVNGESIRGGRRRPNYDLVHGTATRNEPLSGEEEGLLKKAVIGGVDANNQQRPYQVSLQRTDSGVHFCGGAIIEKHYILTAAHCLQSVPVNWLLIRYATLTYNSGGLTARAKRIIVHEEYDNQTVDNDIALIQTVEPLVYKAPNSMPVALPSFGSEPPAGQNITISGWGYLQEDSMRFSKNLQVAAVSVVNRDRCNAIYDGEITSNMICAESKGVDACQGDSGSPAVNHYRQLVGLVSWGIGCARPGLPGIYTKVGNYVNWISQRTGNPEKVPTNWKYVPKVKPRPKPSPTRPAATNGEFLPNGDGNSAASNDLLLPEVVGGNATDDPSAITDQVNLANISDITEEEKEPAEGLTGGAEDNKKGIDMTTVYIIIIIICASVPACIFLVYYLVKRRNSKGTNDNNKKKRKDGVDGGGSVNRAKTSKTDKKGDPTFTDPLLEQQQHTSNSNNNNNGPPSPAAHPDRIEIGIERIKKEKHNSNTDLTAGDIPEPGNDSFDEDDEEEEEQQEHEQSHNDHPNHDRHESTGPVDPNVDHFTGNGNLAPVSEPTVQEHHFAANPPSPIYANQPFHQKSSPPPVPPHATTASSRNDDHHHEQPQHNFHSSTPTQHRHNHDNDHHTSPSSYSNNSYHAAPTSSYSNPSHNDHSYHSSSYYAPSTSHNDHSSSSHHNDDSHNSHDSYSGYD